MQDYSAWNEEHHHVIPKSWLLLYRGFMRPNNKNDSQKSGPGTQRLYLTGGFPGALHSALGVDHCNAEDKAPVANRDITLTLNLTLKRKNNLMVTLYPKP